MEPPTPDVQSETILRGTVQRVLPPNNEEILGWSVAAREGLGTAG